MKPPKRVWPSADHERETHSGSRAPALCAKSGLSSSTIDLPRSCQHGGRGNSGLQVYALALKVEDLDARCGRSTPPVAVGGEDEGVDDVTCLERVQVLALVQVPEHSDAVLAAGGRERTIRRDGNGVDVAGVAVVVGLELELRELPDLSKKKWVRNSSKRRFGLRVKGSEILVILFGLIGL